MKVKEKRIVFQVWNEDDNSKTGWISYGWVFKDSWDYIRDLDWTVVEHLESDKFGNPTLGVAEKETEI
jgi:hypothetical protein